MERSILTSRYSVQREIADYITDMLEECPEECTEIFLGILNLFKFFPEKKLGQLSYCLFTDTSLFFCRLHFYINVEILYQCRD